MTYQPHHSEDVSLKTGNEGTVPAAVPADLIEGWTTLIDQWHNGVKNPDMWMAAAAGALSAARVLATSAPPPVEAREPAGQLPRELMESYLAAAQEATFAGFDDSVLKEWFAPGPGRRLLETVYRMGFESGWRIREQQIAATHPKEPTEAREASAEGAEACGNYECKAAQRDGVLCAEGECRDAAPGMVEEPSSKEPTEARGDGVKENRK